MRHGDNTNKSHGEIHMGSRHHKNVPVMVNMGFLAFMKPFPKGA